MECLVEHLCRLDHLLPKDVLLALDESPQTLSPENAEMVALLDRLLIRFLAHIDSVTLSDDKVQYKLNLQSMLREFIPIFEKVLLAQPSTRNVQFILFYLLSLKSSFTDSFCDWLLKRLIMPNAPLTKRLAAASYLAGFLARAEFAPKSTLQTTVKILSSFALDYIRTVPEASQCHSTDKFMPFYIVTQAMFYLVIFRQSEIGLDTLREAKISAIVFSKFNPLGSCVPAIATKFCDVMKEKEIAYCHGILEKTRQTELLTRGRGQEVNPIDFYFPFDPCLLPRVAEKVDTFYNHWSDDSDSESEDDSDDDESMDES